MEGRNWDDSSIRFMVMYFQGILLWVIIFEQVFKGQCNTPRDFLFFHLSEDRFLFQYFEFDF